MTLPLQVIEDGASACRANGELLQETFVGFE
jgi:hypothetical protein